MEDPSLHLKLEESQGTLLSRPMFVHELESILDHGHELVQWSIGKGVENQNGGSSWYCGERVAKKFKDLNFPVYGLNRAI